MTNNSDFERKKFDCFNLLNAKLIDSLDQDVILFNELLGFGRPYIFSTSKVYSNQTYYSVILIVFDCDFIYESSNVFVFECFNDFCLWINSDFDLMHGRHVRLSFFLNNVTDLTYDIKFTSFYMT